MKSLKFLHKVWFYLLIIVILFTIIFIISTIIVNREINKNIEILKTDLPNNTEIITIKDLENLPSPVKKWLTSINIVGKKRMVLVSFSQTGKMKLKKENTDFYKPNAKQYVRIDKPSFLWYVDLKMNPLLKVKGIDFFNNNKGSMKMLLASIFPVVNEKSNERINESSLSRFLLELPWYPTAALEDYIIWEEIDETSAKAVINIGDLKTEAIFYFDENGTLLKMVSYRYKENLPNSEKIPCIGEVKGNIIKDDITVPNKIDVTWIDNNEEFTWYKIENYNINFYDY